MGAALSDADPRGRAGGGAAALPLPDQVALVLQGGGALGSFQAGVYEALIEAGIEVDHIAGISIGAVNAAIIAGNPPDGRVAALTGFWEKLGSGQPSFPIWATPEGREWLHEWSAAAVASFGVPGFFTPRGLPPMFAAPGSMGALSIYDSTPLEATLDAYVDWNLLNDGPVRLAVGAVDIASGNLRYFDTADERLDARHIMASGALPPGLPPVEIDGRLYWDGGLVSNTPLAHMLDTQTCDMLVFQVDLFPAAGAIPKTFMDVAAREKEIRFSSRTRQVSDQLVRLRCERETIRALLAKLPPALAADPDAVALAEASREYAVNVVQLVYRANAWEGGARDYEFSARTMAEHWAAGRAAVAETMTRAGLIARNILDGRTAAFDLVHPTS